MALNGAVEHMRTQLWQKLGSVFSNYADSTKNQIPISKVQLIIHDALGQQTLQEIDYVIKNMFRLDSDSSGTVSFEEFGNFMFKRHCGEMSLQKMHMLNQIKNGSQRKITVQQFGTLINNAYKFLNVKVQNEVIRYVFDQTDIDHDGLITYVEYFQLINNYVCRSSNIPVKKAPPIIQTTGKQHNSRLRSYMWIKFKKLYESYIHGRYLSASDKQMRGLIGSIVGDLSQTEMSDILTDLFKLNMRFIEFQPFAMHFLYLIAKLRLSRFNRYHNFTKRTLSKDQFYVLFKNTYHFLSLGRIKLSFLQRLYHTIDQNKDGVISYEEYLDWVKRYVSVSKYFGQQFYFRQDDLDISSSEDYMFDADRKPVQNKKIAQHIRFTFKDHLLAYAVRQRMYGLLVEYDANHDHLFDETQIKNALTGILRQDPIELKYVTMNVFRYDRDGDKNVTYEQLTNFCVQQHFGEMAIQRLHRQNSYTRGKQRIMNQQQFALTLNYGLSFIHLEATPAQVKSLFNQIDLDHDGWISYEVYFFFLKYYFGSLSVAASKPLYEIKHKAGSLKEDQLMLALLHKLNVLERFVRLIMDQLKEICKSYDYNHNMIYEAEQIQAILSQVFQLFHTEIDYIMYNYFRFNIRKEKATTYQQFIAIALQIYFIQILFKRKYHSDDSQVWIHKRISIQEFIDLLYEPCFFIRVRPLKEDLLLIFEILDNDKDGFISFEDYINFIRKYLGRGLQIVDKLIKQEPLKEKPIVTGVSDEEVKLVEVIWGELKVYFDRYDAGKKGFLKQSELKTFAVQVLHESSQRQLDYIFWNLFRVDSNTNRQVDFQEFAPFILKHAGQISLQRFHREQLKGKNSLNQQQLFSVLNGAYGFLISMPKNKSTVSNIFQRINKSNIVGYSNYLQWIQDALAKRFR